VRATRDLPNHLLRALPAAELEALAPHLEIVELVRETVLVEAGGPLTHVYLPHSGVISMRVRLSEGQTVEVATVGRDSIFGAAAALGGGISLTDAVVLLPARPAFSALPRFGLPPIGAWRYESCWRDTNRPCLHMQNNPPHAMSLTRSKRACRAGCCGHATSATSKTCH
jgi:CRP-like cAMP-binding protein